VKTSVEKRLEVWGESVDALRKRLFAPAEGADTDQGVFLRSWPVGTTALLIAGLLSAYVLVYYL
jgi:multicomponent Na+:H+ antiporter subunit D